MGGPWEKYQQASAAPDDGPWLKYQSPKGDQGHDLGADIGTKLEENVLFGSRPFWAGVGGGIGSAAAQLDNPNLGISDRIKGLGDTFQKGFSEARQGALKQESDVRERRPGLSLGMDVGSAFLTAPLFAAKGIQGVRAATEAARAAEGASLLGKVTNVGKAALAGTPEAARIGALFGAGHALGHAEDANQAVNQTLTGAALGAGTQGAINAAGLTIPAAWNVGKTAAKRGMSVVFGPNENAINQYLERADAIRNYKSVEQIKNGIDDIVENFTSSVKNGEIARDEAKAAYKEIQSRISTATSEAKAQHAIAGADLRDTLREAKRSFENALKVETEKLSAVKSPIQMADDVQTAMQDLKQQIKRGSEESYKILERDSGAYSVRNAAPILRQMAEEMNIQPWASKAPEAGAIFKSGYKGQKPLGGEFVAGSPSGPVTSQTAGVQQELRRFAERLENTPEAVPARELKKILQQIDNSEKAMYGQPGFDSRVSQAYKMVRSTIDQAVKDQNPAYREKMAEVAQKTDLFSKALERFGDPRATVSRLNSIGSRTAGADQELLGRLGAETGFDFMTPVQQFVENQAVLKNPAAMEKLAQSLPEWQAQRLAELSQRAHARPESAAKAIESATAPIIAERKAAGEVISQAQSRLDKAMSELEPFKRLSEGKTQGAVENLLRNPGRENIETRRALEQLSKASGQDFIQMINDLRSARSFQGEYRNGSRNVVMLGGVGFTLGGPTGATIGGIMGGIVDRYGPKMAQKILDGVLKTQPTTDKIASTLSQYVERVAPRSTTALNGIENSVMSRRLDRLRGNGGGSGFGQQK